MELSRRVLAWHARSARRAARGRREPLAAAARVKDVRAAQAHHHFTLVSGLKANGAHVVQGRLECAFRELGRTAGREARKARQARDILEHRAVQPL